MSPTATAMATTAAQATEQYRGFVLSTLQVGLFALIFGLSLVISLAALQAGLLARR